MLKDYKNNTDILITEIYERCITKNYIHPSFLIDDLDYIASCTKASLNNYIILKEKYYQNQTSLTTCFNKYLRYLSTNEGDFAYIKEQLQWLGLEDTFSEKNYLDDKIVNKSKKSELIKYLDSLVDKKILEDEQQLISDMIKSNFNEISNKIKNLQKKLQ